MKRKLTEQQVMDESDPSPAVQALRDQLRDATTELDSLKTRIGEDEAVVASLKGGLKALPPYRSAPRPKERAGHAEHEAVLLLADPHSDEFVSAAEMEGMAAHTWETHVARMGAIADKTAEMTSIVRGAAPVRRLNVWLMGDWFLGQIHPEEGAYGETMTMPLALPAAGRVLADCIMRMAAGFDHTRVVGIVGNHGRNTRKPVFKLTADRNWDMAVYLIAREFAREQSAVEWVLPKSIMHNETVLGSRNLLTHGNCVSITHRTPYFGIEDTFFKQRNARRGTDQDFDHVWMGHLHHPFDLRGFIHGCPSIIGGNQFSLYKMHSATTAGARLVYFTEKHGPTCEWLINLE